MKILNFPHNRPVILLVASFVFGEIFHSQRLQAQEIIRPVRTETVEPIRNQSFNKDGTCRTREQGGNPRQIEGCLVFDGSQDGNRQVDPQIAVGKNHVLHATNSGLIVYSKAGKFISGVRQNCFNGGIDPKLFYDRHNDVFGFDLWNPWDDAEEKPVNISVSESGDPTGAWNTYPVPAPEGVDGGGIGYSRKWIGYSFPGGPTQTFVIQSEPAIAGEEVTVYHFPGRLGHPVQTQDEIDELYFLKLTNRDLILTKVYSAEDGSALAQIVTQVKHGFEFFGWPPQSPQQNSDQKTASGDRNPKNIVLQNGCIWFSHTVNCDGRAAVQWHQVKLDGEFVQSGILRDEKRSFIQTTIAVNSQDDVLVGYQETGTDMFISPRFAYRLAGDALGELREPISLGEGQAATDGAAWGDYSGSVVDGDNLLDLWTIQSITDDGGKGDTVIAKLPIEKN